MKKEENNAPKEKNNIPKDLQNKINALKALVSIHDLLSTAKYEGFKTKRLSDAFEFIESLHKQLLDDVSSHPDAQKALPELFKKDSKEE
jgi:hypothetical protein